MKRLAVTALLCAILLTLALPRASSSTDILPKEPDINTRLDELYDHEARLFLMLFSLKGDGVVDYITGRMVEETMRSNYGNPVYYTQSEPLFYW